MVIRILLVLLLGALPVRADTLRLIVPEMRPVVGEMIPITIRGEYTGAISVEKMVFPDSAAYDWIQVARDRWADERVEGRLFRTFERRIALFPRQSGTLTIGPVTHQLTKSEGMTRPVFDVTARPVTLAVTPYPGAGRPLAARHIEVRDEFSADPAKLRDGETFTRRLTITAEGTMAHLLPPRPDIREPWLISFTAPEIRETRLTAEGPVAVAVWEWTLRPHTGERGTLMPLQFPWFNTLIREMRGAVTLPVEIGLASFGGNLGGASRPLPLVGMQAAALVAGGLVAALLAGLVGLVPAGRHRLMQRLRRLLPNPRAKAVRQAAVGGSLAALRGAALDYIASERRLGRKTDPAPMALLEQALYAPSGTGTASGDGQAFDRQAFLRGLFTRPRS